ncbi:hypothetical protein [Arenibaculum pallidiluteum]|uniref:hypothetical protein n=1 Tax=Arenibaculum pallidiluteum TaxID=2812559 RepID=UPI001A973361|nr:hypothetical protein [Arenibaculum pallidiluteum]
MPMPIARRYMVRLACGTLVDLPRRAFDRAEDGVAPLQQFAGRCVDLVFVVLVERKDGPLISHVDFPRVYFDRDGFVDAGMRARMIRLMLESCRHETARASLDREFAWHPDRRVLDQVRLRFGPSATLRAPHGPPTTLRAHRGPSRPTLH